MGAHVAVAAVHFPAVPVRNTAVRLAHVQTQDRHTEMIVKAFAAPKTVAAGQPFTWADLRAQFGGPAFQAAYG